MMTKDDFVNFLKISGINARRENNDVIVIGEKSSWKVVGTLAKTVGYVGGYIWRSEEYDKMKSMEGK